MNTKSAFSSALCALVILALAAPLAHAGKELLMDPAKLKEQAPETYQAKFETSQGDFVVEVTRAWAPNGADRFYNLVKNGYYDDQRFFRVVPGFMVQWGIHGDPAVAAAWRPAMIQADPVKQSNKKGYITYAQSSNPNSRTTQVFINYGDNSRLDAMSFSPFGKVTQGMDVVEKLHGGYGDGAPSGRGPDQGKVQAEGNAYLVANFPKLDHIKKATIVGKPAPAAATTPAPAPAPK